jgi:hypothetical protein
VLLAILVWLIPILIRGWRLSSLNMRLPMIAFTSYFFGSLLIILFLIYGMHKDISLAARYHFIYFPVLILLVASALAVYYQDKITFRFFIVFLLIALLGSFTVVTNFGFQKSRHSDRLAVYVQENLPASSSSLVAMTYETSSELREFVGLALSFERLRLSYFSFSSSRFLLLDSESSLSSVLSSSSFDLVAVNLDVDDDQLTQLGCIQDSALNLSNSGYDDRFYHCSL